MKSKPDGVFACSYVPVKPIKHTISIVWGGANVPSSPFRVSRTLLLLTACCYKGDSTFLGAWKQCALLLSCVGTFPVEKSFLVLQARAGCFVSVQVQPLPKQCFSLTVILNVNQVCNSDTCESIQVLIGQGSHPQKVKVFGPGVERTGLKASEPTHFTVDCTDAGEGKGRLDYCCGILQVVRGWVLCSVSQCWFCFFLLSRKTLRSRICYDLFYQLTWCLEQLLEVGMCWLFG